MDLKERLNIYIIKAAPVTMDKVIHEATTKGFSEHEVLAALDTVHKDKRIAQKVSALGVVTYTLATAKEKTDTGTWLRDNYPWPANFEMPFPDWNLSWMFLTPQELLEYKARAKGMPVHMMKNHERK